MSKETITIRTNVHHDALPSDVACVHIDRIDDAAIIECMMAQRHLVWGLKLGEGVLYPVDVPTPIRQDLDGWVSISKEHCALKGSSYDSCAKAKDAVITALVNTFVNPITQKSLVAIRKEQLLKDIGGAGDDVLRCTYLPDELYYPLVDIVEAHTINDSIRVYATSLVHDVLMMADTSSESDISLSTDDKILLLALKEKYEYIELHV